MKYLLIKNIYSFDGTFNEYEIINIEKYNELDPKWYHGGIKNASEKIYSHLKKSGDIDLTYMDKISDTVKLLVDGKYAIPTIQRYSTFEISNHRKKALDNDQWDWKLYNYSLYCIGSIGSDFDTNGIVSPRIYNKLKSLKDSIHRITNVKYNSISVKMNDEKTYLITDERMSEYISISDFASWRGVKTIDTMLSLNHLVHETSAGTLFKIPGAKYKFINGSMVFISDKILRYESKFNKRETYDVHGNKLVTLLDEDTGILYTVLDKDFNHTLELA